MKFRCLILAFYLGILANAYSQVVTPKMMVIDFSTQDANVFLKSIKSLDQISILRIKNLNEKVDFGDLSKNLKLENLEFENCQLSLLLNFLENPNLNSNIRSIKLNNINQDEIQPQSINIKLKNIIIEGCSPELVSDFFNSLKDKTAMSISLNYCSLLNIPTEVFNFPKLQSLNVEDNLISEIDSKICNLKSLDTLNISQNYILEPCDEYLKLANTQVRTLIIDSILNNCPKQLHDILEKINIIYNSNYGIQNDENEEVYGEIKTTDGDLKILSSAYLIFPKIYQKEIGDISEDTARLEERFWDSNYLGIYKVNRQIGFNQSFKIYKTKSPISKKIAFTFGTISDQKVAKYFLESYPEFNSFRNMVWIIDDTMSVKYFNKVFKKIYFYDIRLKYNSDKQLFTVILKSSNEIYSIDTKPMFPRKNKGIIYSQKEYPRLYAKYLVVLTNRAKRFDKEIDKNAMYLQLARQKYRLMIYNEMLSQMSAVERTMSMDDWYKYYARVIENELELLKNSKPNKELIERTLILLGYSTPKTIQSSVQNPVFKDVIITDNFNNNLPIIDMFTIDKSNMTYTFKQQQVPFSSFVFQQIEKPLYLIGLTEGHSVSLSQLPAGTMTTNRLASNYIENNLVTIGQILQILEL